MNLEMLLGIIFIFGGTLTLIGRIFKIEKLFWKLDKMKAFWGATLGSIIHFVFYGIIPLVAGIILIITNL
ncbi:MAG: hypothetical protein JW827_09000 [Spirochaetes bacterium]|nr:hypothetical protein [Spirochaetota bacterium]